MASPGRGFSGTQQQAYEGQPWEGSFFIALQLACKSQPWGGFFYCCRQAPACGEREVTIAALPPACYLAIVPCFHGSPVFLHRHSLLEIPPSHLLSLSPHSQQQFSLWACSPIPTHQLPAPLHTCEHTSQSGACRAVVWTICVFLSLSHLPQISHFTLFWQPQMLPFCPNRFPRQRESFPVGEGVPLNSGTIPLFQFPHPRVQVPSRFLSSSFSLLYFSILPSYAGIFIVLSSVQGLPLVFSQCSVRIVAFIDVFLMHPWREMNFMSTYSSAILNLQPHLFIFAFISFTLGDGSKKNIALIYIKECPAYVFL